VPRYLSRICDESTRSWSGHSNPGLCHLAHGSSGFHATKVHYDCSSATLRGGSGIASKEDIDSGRLKDFTLSIQAPAGQNFDFAESIAFFAEASGQPRVRIAHLDAVPKGVSSFPVSVDPGVELKPYVTAPQMSITTEAQGSRPPQETTVKADVVLDVDIHTGIGCE